MRNDSSDLKLTVYTRDPCPLCDHLVLALELLRARHRFRYEKIYINDDSGLTARYGDRVPVLKHEELELCAGHCEPSIIEEYICAQTVVTGI